MSYKPLSITPGASGNLALSPNPLTGTGTVDLQASLSSMSSIVGSSGGPIAATDLTSNVTQINNVVKGTSVATTTGLTPANIITIPVPTNKNLVATVNLLANDTTSNLGAYAITTPGVKNVSGTVSEIGASLPSVVFTFDMGFTVIAAWSIVGTDLLLTVTGVAVDTVKWACSYEYFIA